MGFMSKILGAAMPGSGAEIAGAMGKMETVMTTLVGKVAERTPPGVEADPAAMFASIGEIFSCPETQRMVTETADAARGLFAAHSGAAAPPREVHEIIEE